ncbi:MAG: Rad52/Rad22 family DNA repair protein [Cyanobacteria bacterium J06648_11]
MTDEADKSRHKPFRRPLGEILDDLSKPIPDRFLGQRKQGGSTITYVPWYEVTRLMDFFAPGWSGEVASVTFTDTRVTVVYRITIHAAEGDFHREATGTEVLNKSFGDPITAAEQQAFKRACARWGLGLELYGE